MGKNRCKLTPAERECIIRRAMDEKSWDIWCEVPTMLTKLRKGGWQPTDKEGRRFSLPLKAVSIRSSKSLQNRVQPSGAGSGTRFQKRGAQNQARACSTRPRPPN